MRREGGKGGGRIRRGGGGGCKVYVNKHINAIYDKEQRQSKCAYNLTFFYLQALLARDLYALGACIYFSLFLFPVALSSQPPPLSPNKLLTPALAFTRR